MDPAKKYKIIRDGGQVKRCHTVPNFQGHYDVAQHTFNVVGILICCVGMLTNRLIKAAMFHDLHEQVTGDIPAPTKWANPKLVEALTEIEQRFDQENELVEDLTPLELEKLIYADRMELYFWAIDNDQLDIVTRLNKWFEKHPAPCHEMEMLRKQYAE